MHMSVHTLIQMSMHMSVYMSTHTFIHMSTHMFVRMTPHIYMPVSVSYPSLSRTGGTGYNLCTLQHPTTDERTCLNTCLYAYDMSIHKRHAHMHETCLYASDMSMRMYMCTSVLARMRLWYRRLWHRYVTDRIIAMSLPAFGTTDLYNFIGHN